MTVRRLVIDVLIPHHPEVIEYAQRLSSLQGTDGLAVHVLEHDERTKTLEMTIEGEDLSFDSIRRVIEDMGGSIHSVDMVSAGSRIVESRARRRRDI